ncbi:MAG: hypothetical protein QOD51_1550 [Candidatus Eremiobacteraeota bacterium]|nr:hypothetical protein [Candidatus Eremiobacteraeota bacterium]
MTVAAAVVTRENPFIGLRPFDEQHADVFFGREKQVDKLLERLAQTRFLAVVGSSGCGKSSLVLAGLVPALRRGSIQQAGRKWRIAKMRPGSSPIHALADALAQPGILAADAGDMTARRAMIEHALERGELGLVDLVFRARMAADENLLVIVDQFEELFTYAGSAEHAADETDAAAFVKLLLAAAARSDLPIYVTFTMRSDFLGECARFRDLPEAVTEGLFLVPRLTRDEIQRAIVEPIVHAGARIEPRLVSRLLNDIGRDSDQLPVLQHALMKTWDEWQRRNAPDESIDVVDYKAIGELSGALSQHAENIYASLTAEQQVLAEKLFRCITVRDAENRGVRRPTAFALVLEITGAAAADVEKLIATYNAPGVSFLTPSGPPPYDGAVLDLSHESLMRLWKRLCEWVEREADSAQIYRRLVDDALVPRALWIDPDLAIGRAWLAANKGTVNPAWAARYDDALKKSAPDAQARHAAASDHFERALAFLAASTEAPLKELRRARDAENRRRYLLRTTVLTCTAIVVIAAVAISLWFGQQARSARAQASNAQQETARARAATDALAAREQHANDLAFALQQKNAAVKIAADRAYAKSEREKQLAAVASRQAAYDRARAAAATAEANALRAQAANEKLAADASMRRAQVELATARAASEFNAGAALAERHDFPGAIRSYTAAIAGYAMNPAKRSDRASAYIGRADAYLELHQNAKAQADYTSAIALDPHRAEPYAQRASFAYGRGAYGQAISDYNHALAINPNDARSRQARNAAFVQQTLARNGIAPVQTPRLATPPPPQIQHLSTKPLVMPSQSTAQTSVAQSTAGQPTAGQTTAAPSTRKNGLNACAAPPAYLRTAAVAPGAAQAAFDAANAGIAANAACVDTAYHRVNEAFLMSQLAAAERTLRKPDWQKHLKAANDLLDWCATSRDVTDPTAPPDCRTQRQRNDALTKPASAK